MDPRKEMGSIPLEYIMCSNYDPREIRIGYTIEHEHLVVATPLQGKAL